MHRLISQQCCELKIPPCERADWSISLTCLCRRWLMSLRLCIVSGYPITVPPCRSLCIAVRDACLPTMASFGYSWPHILNCSVFPSAAKKLCIPGEKLISAAGELDLLFGHQVKRKQNKNETAIDLDIKFMYRLIMVESIILSSITDIEIGIKKQGLCLKVLWGC